MTTATIMDVLEKIPTPVNVKAWRVETGEDWAGEPAAWVWATLRDQDVDVRANREAIRQLVRAAVLSPDSDVKWVYVSFRGESEDGAH